MSDRPASLRQYVDGVIADALARCTRCGRCYEACPMPLYSRVLDGARATDTVAGVLQVLAGAPGSPEAIEWIRICTQSASCIPACPEGIDPMKMLRAGRMVALGALGGEKRIPGREDPDQYRRIDAFAALQLSDAELADWNGRPRSEK